MPIDHSRSSVKKIRGFENHRMILERRNLSKNGSALSWSNWSTKDRDMAVLQPPRPYEATKGYQIKSNDFFPKAYFLKGGPYV